MLQLMQPRRRRGYAGSLILVLNRRSLATRLLGVVVLPTKGDESPLVFALLIRFLAQIVDYVS